MLMVLASHSSIALDKAQMFTKKDIWFKSTVELLYRIIGLKDKLFPENRDIIKKYVSLLGSRLSLNSNELELLDLAASIQDIAKLIIPDNVLQKEKELSAKDWDEIRKHPVISAEILETIEEFKDIIPIIKYHHERYDGKGYPEGLAGENIPKLSRILAVADAFAAMTSRRPYKNAMTITEAKKEIEKQSGKQFDPEIAGEFIKLLENH